MPSKRALLPILPRTESQELEEVLERLANLLGAERREVANADDLKDVQVRALRYLSRCNRYSDTPAALADFLGLTKGTVSQTVSALEAKGFVTKTKDAADGRVVHLSLTAEGQRVVGAAFPSRLLDETSPLLPPGELGELAERLRGLLRALQRSHGFATFGVCASCGHFRKEGSDASAEAVRFRCGLTQEVLLPLDSTKLCREHSPAPSDAGWVRFDGPT